MKRKPDCWEKARRFAANMTEENSNLEIGNSKQIVLPFRPANRVRAFRSPCFRSLSTFEIGIFLTSRTLHVEFVQNRPPSLCVD